MAGKHTQLTFRNSRIHVLLVIPGGLLRKQRQMLELEIERALDPPGVNGRKGLQKVGEGDGSGAKNGIDLCHVCPIKKVESLCGRYPAWRSRGAYKHVCSR